MGLERELSSSLRSPQAGEYPKVLPPNLFSVILAPRASGSLGFELLFS